MSKKLNDAPILDQLDAHWQKIAALLLWKLVGRNKVTITAAEIASMNAEFQPSQPVIFTHGHKDSIDFQIVTEEDAKRIAAHQKTMTGRA